MNSATRPVEISSRSATVSAERADIGQVHALIAHVSRVFVRTTFENPRQLVNVLVRKWL